MTDRDVLAVLVRAPFCGPMSPAHYATLSDRQIVGIYFAARDEDGVLIPLRGGSSDPFLDDWQRQRIDRSSQELPSPESLAIPEEVMHSQVYGTNPHWAVMYFDTWRRRGQTVEQTLARWKAEGHGDRHF